MGFFYPDKTLTERFDDFLEKSFYPVRAEVFHDTTNGRKYRVRDLEAKVKYQEAVIEALLDHFGLEVMTWPERRVLQKKRKRHTNIIEELEKRAKR